MHEASGLVASSPNLPPVGTLRFASLSSSHTNMVLKSFATGQKHPDERLTMAGKLSPEKIHAVDESFYEAITQGITTIYIYGFCDGQFFWDREYKVTISKVHSLPIKICCLNPGMVWTCIHHMVLEEFPSLAGLIQSAANASQQVSQSDPHLW